MKKTLAIIMVIIMSLTIMGGCSQGAEEKQDAVKGNASTGANSGKSIKDDDIQIAFIPISTAGYQNVLSDDAAKDIMMRYPNAKVNSFDAEYNANKQISIISECIAQKYDAIVIEVADAVAVSPSITEAEEAGIPVITMNMGAEAVHTMHIEANSYTSGWVGGEALDKALNGEGKVILLDVPAELKATALFGTGFEEYIAQNTKFELIDVQNVPGFSQEEANKIMRDLLTKHDDIAAVYCIADDVAMGAIQAIEASGRGKDGILVWGSAGYPAAFDAIEKGTLYGTCWADVFGETKTALAFALYFIESGVTGTGLGYAETPTIQETFYPVTKENLDVIKPQTHWPEYS